ncbi:MAG TPA: ectoine synthase [Noviherbaspirillum sp.]
MIVRDIEQCKGTEREVKSKTWTSLRVLLASDKMGFSLHETTMFRGTETPMQYLNHLEAVLCVEGEGEVELCETGANYPIKPGTVYALDQHDRHIVRAKSDLRLICVFNPPLHGKEVHDADGSYPSSSEIPPGIVTGKGERK